MDDFFSFVIVSIIEYITKNNLKVPKIKYIECHSERLYSWQEQMIINLFGVKPVSIYSSNEVQFMGVVCNNNHMHVFSNTCFIEVIENQDNNKEICVTSLNYLDVPIIRYKLGDCGNWSEEQNCDCNLKGLPIIQLKGFRTNDFVITKNRTKLEPFVKSDSIYLLSNKLNFSLNKYKVIQLNYDTFEFYLD